MALIRIDGVDFGYDEAGSGPAVVLVHGGLADRRMWDHQFRALAARYRVIRYDWRGYGESGDAAGEVAHHEDLLALLGALEVERAALVGASFGGAYAVDAALAAPSRISALALLCAGLSGHDWPPQMLEQARALIRQAVPAERLGEYQARTAAVVDPADVAAMAEAQARFMIAGPGRDPADLDQQFWERALLLCRGVFWREWTGPLYTQRWLEPPAVGRLGEIAVPTFVLNGLADVPYIQAVSDLLSTGIPGAKRIDLPDTGHMPAMERPIEVSDALLEFLGESR